MQICLFLPLGSKLYSKQEHEQSSYKHYGNNCEKCVVRSDFDCQIVHMLVTKATFLVDLRDAHDCTLMHSFWKWSFLVIKLMHNGTLSWVIWKIHSNWDCIMIDNKKNILQHLNSQRKYGQDGNSMLLENKKWYAI